MNGVVSRFALVYRQSGHFRITSALSLWFDPSIGATLWRRDNLKLNLQADAENLNRNSLVICQEMNCNLTHNS